MSGRTGTCEPTAIAAILSRFRKAAQTVISLRVPASTSNLGAGFDTFGLALELYLDVDVEPDPSAPDGQLSFVFSGEGADELADCAENLIATAFRLAASKRGLDFPALRFAVRNQIPVTRGLGSSAAAVVAGLAAFKKTVAPDFSIAECLDCGFELEGHLDNIGASLFGGFVTSCTSPDRAPIVVSQPWPSAIGLIVAIPSRPLSTSAARRVVPVEFSREDAIFNLQRVALLHAALATGRFECIGEALRDRLHQPYRQPLMPGFAEAFALDGDPHLLGVALSGAGSSVIALSTGNFTDIGERLAGCFRRYDIPTKVLALGVDTAGCAAFAPGSKS